MVKKNSYSLVKDKVYSKQSLQNVGHAICGKDPNPIQHHLSSDGVTCYQYFCSSPHCCGGQKRKKPKPLQVPMSWLTPCPPQHFSGGFSGLECSSTEMVLELKGSAADSPLPMLPHTPAMLMAP